MSEFSDVNKFLNNFDGGARPNRYKVSILRFPSLVTRDAGINTEFSFLCRSTSLPTSTLAPCIVNYMGREVKIPGDRTFDDWSVTIYNNINWKVRRFFEQWSDLVLANFDNISSMPNEQESNWAADALIEQLDRREETIATYYMKSIYPNLISDIPLGYDTNNAVEEFTVTFSVNYWISTGNNSTPITKSDK